MMPLLMLRLCNVSLYFLKSVFEIRDLTIGLRGGFEILNIYSFCLGKGKMDQTQMQTVAYNS